jgi:AcrR family transcriptional regulator
MRICCAFCNANEIPNEGLCVTELPRKRSDSGGNSKMPVQARGRHQRSKLLMAARHTFQRIGYADTRVSDIVRQAGVAHGTFYTYFDSREDILTAIATEVFAMLAKPLMSEGNSGRTVESVRAGIPAYVDAFQKVADVIAVVEQASAMHSSVKHLHVQFRDRLVTTFERAIADAWTGYRTTWHGRSTAWVIYGALDALLHAWLIDGDNLKREEVCAAVDHLFETWISPRHAGVEPQDETTRTVKGCPIPALRD